MGVQESESLPQLKLPPGFRFFPTDEELLVQYLCKKVAGHDFSLQIIGEIDLYKFDPWMLPSKAIFGEKEWYFFSPRDRKYPNGSRPNRMAGCGYWKATGTDKIITTQGRKVGIKKALVFYVGKAPKGTKTNWIMHEYRLTVPPRKHGSSRLDDWVLCRIYKKNSCGQLNPPPMYYGVDFSGQNKVEHTNGSASSSSASYQLDDKLESLPEIDDRCFSLPRMSHHHHQQQQEDEEQKMMSFQSFDDWASLAGFNSVPELTPQPIQSTQPHWTFTSLVNDDLNSENHMFMHDEEVRSGMRINQRVDDNSGSMFNSNAYICNSVDPFVIRHPNHLGA